MIIRESFRASVRARECQEVPNADTDASSWCESSSSIYSNDQICSSPRSLAPTTPCDDPKDIMNVCNILHYHDAEKDIANGESTHSCMDKGPVCTSRKMSIDNMLNPVVKMTTSVPTRMDTRDAHLIPKPVHPPLHQSIYPLIAPRPDIKEGSSGTPRYLPTSKRTLIIQNCPRTRRGVGPKGPKPVSLPRSSANRKGRHSPGNARSRVQTPTSLQPSPCHFLNSLTDHTTTARPHSNLKYELSEADFIRFHKDNLQTKSRRTPKSRR